MSVRLSIREQVDSLGNDLAILRAFAERKDPHVRGVALAAAHAVLILAVSLPVDDEERFVREDILADVLVALDHVGLGHIRLLVDATRPFDVLASTVALSVERLQ